MNAKLILVIILLVELGYEIFRLWITERHRQQPLPKEVSDIYEPSRYQTYLAYTKDHRTLFLKKKAVSFVVDLIILYTPFFKLLEKVSGGNVYFLFGLTFAFIALVGGINQYIFSYIDTFKIEEKYSLNKKDLKEFYD